MFFRELKRLWNVWHPLFFFSFLNLRSCNKGYYQVLVDPESQDKTTFVSESGKYKFLSHDFWTQKHTGNFPTFDGCDTTNFCRWYIADIYVLSPSWDTHLQHLHHILEKNFVQWVSLYSCPNALSALRLLKFWDTRWVQDIFLYFKLRSRLSVRSVKKKERCP